jgi:hypothetical protein
MNPGLIICLQAIFGECVYGYKETLSLLFGYASILSWLNAQLPYVLFFMN